jgi:methyl-accepting chemotaxis protein
MAMEKFYFIEFITFLLANGSWISFLYTIKRRPELKNWFYTFFLYGIGLSCNIISWFSGPQYGMVQLISVLFYAGAVISLIVATMIDYKKIVGFSTLSTPQSQIRPVPLFYLIFALSTTTMIIVSVEIIIAILVLVCIYLMYRILKLKDSPTYRFFLLSLINAFLVVVSLVLINITQGDPSEITIIFSEDIGFTNTINRIIYQISQGVSLIFSTILFTTSLVSRIEIALNDAKQSTQTLMEKQNKQILAATEISGTLSKTAETINQNVEIISENSENVAQTQQQLAQGALNQQMAIKQILALMETLNSGMKGISDKIKAIESISELIANISEQTSMLALNAAIEAARAGESGRGFSVVADQVRKLAVESSGATNKTNDITKEIQTITSTQERNTQIIFDQIKNVAEIAERNTNIAEEFSQMTEEQVSSINELADISNALLKIAANLKSTFE